MMKTKKILSFIWELIYFGISLFFLENIFRFYNATPVFWGVSNSLELCYIIFWLFKTPTLLQCAIRVDFVNLKWWRQMKNNYFIKKVKVFKCFKVPARQCAVYKIGFINTSSNLWSLQRNRTWIGILFIELKDKENTKSWIKTTGT